MTPETMSIPPAPKLSDFKLKPRKARGPNANLYTAECQRDSKTFSVFLRPDGIHVHRLHTKSAKDRVLSYVDAVDMAFGQFLFPFSQEQKAVIEKEIEKEEEP